MAERIDLETARDHIASAGALLVCAYESPEKCRDNHIGGAITLQELQAREARLARDQELIFYCA
ncbi:MAG: ArsR family transcriptional regulator [Deltaproteobacteria bacterium]|nr:ArsR family transcriptional regulator [Deltaproteobacteria bacterium]MCW5802354.1 ArsR family transcriptional regulator [Deltaproteobacteria bacterium]